MNKIFCLNRFIKYFAFATLRPHNNIYRRLMKEELVVGIKRVNESSKKILIIHKNVRLGKSESSQKIV